MPPPGKIFQSKKSESRKRAKEELQLELSSLRPRKSS
jgi:hypothetical protein